MHAVIFQDLFLDSAQVVFLLEGRNEFEMLVRLVVLQFVTQEFKCQYMASTGILNSISMSLILVIS